MLLKFSPQGNFVENLKLSVPPIWIYVYTIECTIEPPIVWYIQKCMLIWKICFYFSFVIAICSSKMMTRHVKRDRFTGKVLSRRDNFQLARSLHILLTWNRHVVVECV